MASAPDSSTSNATRVASGAAISTEPRRSAGRARELVREKEVGAATIQDANIRDAVLSRECGSRRSCCLRRDLPSHRDQRYSSDLWRPRTGDPQGGSRAAAAPYSGHRNFDKITCRRSSGR
jgi:hypothetical protein